MVRAYFRAIILLLLSIVAGGVQAASEGTDYPTWAELSASQRQVLNPLAAEWDTLRPWQREKMLDIAHDYPKMSAEQQKRVQQRLNDWSRMTPFQRENVRKK